LKQKLINLGAWHTDLKNRRDPPAHRILLYVPPAILSPEEQERYAALDKQISGTKSEQERKVLSAQQRRIGTFMPYFIHHPDEGRMAIYPTVPQDIANLIKVAKLVPTVLAAIYRECGGSDHGRVAGRWRSQRTGRAQGGRTGGEGRYDWARRTLRPRGYG
jgi:hypothetical protein